MFSICMCPHKNSGKNTVSKLKVMIHTYNLHKNGDKKTVSKFEGLVHTCNLSTPEAEVGESRVQMGSIEELSLLYNHCLERRQQAANAC